MKWLLLTITLVLIALFALPGMSENKEDGLVEEKIVRPGETYVVEDLLLRALYGDLGEDSQASLVCIYLFRGQQRTRVYWYAPNDILGKSYCPEQFDSGDNVSPTEDWTLSLYRDVNLRSIYLKVKEMEEFGIIIAIVVGIFTLIGFIAGFFRWLWKKKKPASSKDDGTFKIPRKTLSVVIEGTGHQCWWHMGTSDGNPAMQIIAHFTATNVCNNMGVAPTSARMRKPKYLGHVMARKHDENIYGGYLIPARAITELNVNFWIVPPVKKEGETFKADIAIVDQFGNEHWVKNVEFAHRR